jgi:hypothetical protein
MKEKKEVAQEADEIIASATNCIDRGEDQESGKRGTCHVFRDSDVCMCGEIDLAKERMR